MKLLARAFGKLILCTALPYYGLIILMDSFFEGEANLTKNLIGLGLFVLFDLFFVIGHFLSLKSMGVKNVFQETMKPEYQKTLEYKLTIDEIIQALEQHSWKYSIKEKTETDEYILLHMKFYQLTFLEQVVIKLQKNTSPTVVIISSGLRHKKWFEHPFDYGTNYKRIIYFENILNKQQSLATKLAV